MMRTRTMTSWRSQENSFIVITLYPGVKLYVRRGETFPIPTKIHRRYQNDSCIPGCNDGETNWRLLERGWRKKIIWCMDRLHKIHFIERKGQLMGTHGSGGDLRENKLPLVLTMYGQICGRISDAAKKKVGQRWAIEKPKLDNARQLRRIFFIEPNDEEFKVTIKSRS